MKRVTKPLLEETDFIVDAHAANGIKCERCWRYTEDVGNEKEYPTVCLRCAEALAAIHFAPYTAVSTETPA